MATKKKITKKATKKPVKKSVKRKASIVLKKLPVEPSVVGRKGNLTVPIISLLLNVLFIPGLGTVIGGKIKTGIWQLVLVGIGLIGLFTDTLYNGTPIFVVVWIWGLVSGVRLIQEAS